MTSRQWSELKAYNTFEPVGQGPIIQVLAEIMARFVNVTAKEGSMQVRWEHYMPYYLDPPEQKKSKPEEFLRIFQQLADKQTKNTPPTVPLKRKKKGQEDLSG